MHGMKMIFNFCIIYFYFKNIHYVDKILYHLHFYFFAFSKRSLILYTKIYFGDHIVYVTLAFTLNVARYS